MKKDIQKVIKAVGCWIGLNQLVFVMFFSLLLIAEVLVFPESADIRLFGALALYWLCSRIGTLSSVRVFQVCLVLLGTTTIAFFAYGATDTTERFAVWYVLFMVLGVASQWKER